LPPPDLNPTSVGDIHTGRAYIDTYKELIEPNPVTPSGRHKMLCPLIMYMDGCVTGQYDNLPIEALKFQLGIHDAWTRDRAYTWRNLGFVTKFLKQKSTAVTIIEESGHCDVHDYLSDTSSLSKDEEIVGSTLPNIDDTFEVDLESLDSSKKLEPEIPDCSAQDLHVMLETMLASLAELQDKGGFEWDLSINGKVFRVVFIPYVMFVKGDTVEHDKHCGSFNNRTKYVKQLCRYCCCPTMQSEEPYPVNEKGKIKEWKRKSKAMMQHLVEMGMWRV
jgi:hypothetical protein